MTNMQNNSELINDNFIDLFTKKTLNYYTRKKRKHYIMCVLRASCKDIGLEFIYEEKHVDKSLSSERFYYYSIL